MAIFRLASLQCTMHESWLMPIAELAPPKSLRAKLVACALLVFVALIILGWMHNFLGGKGSIGIWLLAFLVVVCLCTLFFVGGWMLGRPTAAAPELVALPLVTPLTFEQRLVQLSEPLVQALPGAAWVLSHEQSRQLLALNTAARALLLGAPDNVLGLPWISICTYLPADLHRICDALGVNQTAHYGRMCVWHGTLDIGQSGTSQSLYLLTDADSPALATARRDQDSLSYIVSHDLRAPIRVVQGFARILKEDYGHVLDRVGNDHL